jgi:hypothetical protein
MMLADPVAASRRHEQIAVETAGGTKVGILDLCIMAKLGSPGAGFETLLAAHGSLSLKQFAGEALSASLIGTLIAQSSISFAFASCGGATIAMAGIDLVVCWSTRPERTGDVAP